MPPSKQASEKKLQQQQSKLNRRALRAVHTFSNARKESARKAILAAEVLEGVAVTTSIATDTAPVRREPSARRLVVESLACGSFANDDGVDNRSGADGGVRMIAPMPPTIALRSHNKGDGNDGGLPRRSTDLVSLTSHEQAMIRGSHRGSFEFNERMDFDEVQSTAMSEDSFNLRSVDFEHNTQTGQTAQTTLPSTHAGGTTTSADGSSKKRFRFGSKSRAANSNGSAKSSKAGGSTNKRKDKSRNGSVSSGSAKGKGKGKGKSLWKSTSRIKLTSEIHSPEAWMCGVCAKTFATMEAAERHEEYHIREVIYDLGWKTQEELEEEEQKNNSDSILIDMGPSSCAAGTAFRASPMDAKRAVPSPKRSSLEQSNIDTKEVRKLGNHTKVSFLETEMDHIPSSRPFHLKQPPDGLQKSFDAKVHPQKSCIRTPDMEDRFEETERLLVPLGMKDYVVLADEGLADCCNRAEAMILSKEEKDAELTLSLLSTDKKHYDMLAERQMNRERRDKYHKLRTEGKTVRERIQNKFVDAYQLMKEGKAKNRDVLVDHYNRKPKGDEEQEAKMEHNDKTMYVNVVVKNSVRVVSHELERLAKRRWEAENNKSAASGNALTKKKMGMGTAAQAERFQRFRAAAQGNLVKLAGLALASDFTPRRIAVQLSNDVYRHFPPRLKRHGITIESEIEYRVGPFFVLAVNIKRIDWRRFIKSTHRDVVERRNKWQRKQEQDELGGKEQVGMLQCWSSTIARLRHMSKYEWLSYFIAFLYHFHWTIYLPVCWVTYHVLMGNLYRTFILQHVADETFVLVEEKGMEMRVGIKEAPQQAGFMLSALREIRDDGRQLKQKQKESESVDKASLLGPLLGPAVKEDKGPAPPPPDGFVVPESLEFVGLELDLPVGFKRLRWALLNTSCSFTTDAVWNAEAKYENITVEPWSKHDEHIGSTTPVEGVDEADFIGAERNASYLMPKSVFVKANMCSEVQYIESYNDHCFVLKKKALTPDVPYGSTFVAWTKYIVINTGNDTCKMICSVEAEFPNGPPMIARQIKSGMRTGVGEVFVLTGETITKYADEYP